MEKRMLGVLVHQARAEERRHGAHGSPGMRSGATHEGVLPEVAVAGIAAGEGMVGYAQAFVFHRAPDGMQVGMIEQVVQGEVQPDAHRPGAAAPGPDLLGRFLDETGIEGEQSLEAMGSHTAEVVEEPVVGPDEFQVDGRVLMSPGHAGDHELHVDPLFVHVPKAAFGDPFTVGGWEFGAHEFLRPALRVLVGFGLAQGARRVGAPAATAAAEAEAMGVRRFER